MVESAIWCRFGLNVEDLADVDPYVVLQRYCAAKRLEAAAQLDAFEVSQFPDYKQNIRKQAVSRWTAASNLGIVIASTYEGVTGPERLRLIGCSLSSYRAEDWEANHRSELEWLSDNGYSRDDAITADREWTERWINLEGFARDITDGSLNKGDA